MKILMSVNFQPEENEIVKMGGKTFVAQMTVFDKNRCLQILDGEYEVAMGNGPVFALKCSGLARYTVLLKERGRREVSLIVSCHWITLHLLLPI